MSDEHKDVVDALIQVRDVMRLVDSAMVMHQAVHGVELMSPNTVRSELGMLIWAIAKLNGVTEQPSPLERNLSQPSGQELKLSQLKFGRP